MYQSEFSALLQDHTSFLSSIAFKLTRIADDAADLLQDTFERILRNEDKFILGSNFKSWSAVTMRNLYLNKCRKFQRKPFYNADFSNFPERQQPTCTNTGLENLRVARLQQTIEQLDEMYKVPFLMFYRGYHYDEIAEAMGLPIGTLKTRIFYARKKLKAQLAKDEEF